MLQVRKLRGTGPLRPLPVPLADLDLCRGDGAAVWGSAPPEPGPALGTWTAALTPAWPVEEPHWGSTPRLRHPPPEVGTGLCVDGSVCTGPRLSPENPDLIQRHSGCANSHSAAGTVCRRSQWADPAGTLEFKECATETEASSTMIAFP